MRQSTKFILSVFAVTALASAIALVWPTDKIGTSFILPDAQTEIASANIHFSNNRIRLLVETNNHMSCDQISQLLAVGSFSVAGNTYSPICSKTSALTADISYSRESPHE